MQFPAEFEWLSPDGSGLLTAYMANHYGAGWTLHTAKRPAGRARATRTSSSASLAPVAATRNVHAARRVRPRDPGPLGDRRRPRVGAPGTCGRGSCPRSRASSSRRCAPTSEAEPARFWIMPQTRDMNPVYTGKDVSYADTKLAARAGEIAVLEGERLATLAWLRGAAVPGRVARQGVAAARLRRAPRRDHRHRVRRGVPRPARRAGGRRGSAATRRGGTRSRS